MRTLIARHFLTECVDIVLGAGHAFLYGYNSGSYFAETLVRQTDNSNVLDSGMSSEEVLYLNGVEILAAADDNVLFAVNEVDEAVLVLLSHISGEEPAVLEGFGSSLFVAVVAPGPFT